MNATARHSIDDLTEVTATLDMAALTSVMAELGTLNGPAEEAFLAIGSVLGEASGLLGGIQDSFASLVERLDGSEATATANGLERATERIASLAGGNQGSVEMLVRLGDVVRQIEGRLLALSKVVGEVGALAINAKIQASLIETGGTDFTVFTAEIERLGILAGQNIDRTGGRLRELERTITEALSGEHDFERAAADELGRVQGRLAEGLTILAAQRKTAAAAVERVGRHSSDTAQRVVACMTELQFNDTACQRIEHVRDAMGIVTELVRSGTEENIEALVGAVCRLQALQLSRTAADYQERVEILIANLTEIAMDTRGIVDDSEAAISSGEHAVGGHERGSFIDLLEGDITLAARLLTDQAAGRERVKAIVQTVSTGFAQMATDLDAIHSIDADMRVMGLNATFKCARLGDHGRALGVIAHELRSCSKRTEEVSGQISGLLQNAMDVSKGLGAQEGSDAAIVSELGRSMINSLVNLGALSSALDGVLGKLHHDGDRVASLLGGAADTITVHHRMSASLTQAAAKLAGVADLIGIDDADIAGVGERIRTLLAGHYTMQSERLIHQIFADCFSDEPSATTAASEPSANIDDLLF